MFNTLSNAYKGKVHKCNKIFRAGLALIGLSGSGARKGGIIFSFPFRVRVTGVLLYITVRTSHENLFVIMVCFLCDHVMVRVRTRQKNNRPVQ